ncbi:MAG: response regulator [Dehalococcoidia bacterium]|jgi:two-component system NtrC family sensor kinase
MTTEQANKRILVIEDEPVLGVLCRRVLTASGFDVDVVSNGLDARKAADDKEYDMCVSDIRLPGMTGIQLYEHWEKTSNPLADKLIFITGDTLNNYIQEFLKKSSPPCIAKPFEPEELVKAVKLTLS